MAAREFNDLRDFRLRHLVGENAAYTHTMLMDMKHDLDGLVAPFIEEFLEDVDDEFHRCVIVVQHQYLIHRRLLRLRLRLDDDTRTRPFLAALSVLAHFGPRDNAAFWPDDIGFLPLRKSLFLQPGNAHSTAGYSVR